MYNTGIAACEQLKELSFQGNIIPQIWYKVFVKQDLKRPKPHLLAINILADIVFWYRPKEERDEATGALTGYSKRFSSDLLQRSYDQLADLFGCSKGQATEAIVFLEKMGVVERVFRTRNIGGVVCNNILYLSLHVTRLKELTYPQATETAPEVSGDSGAGLAKSEERCPEISGEGVAEFRETNTKTTTKITPEITPSIYQRPTASNQAPLPLSETDGLSDEELRDEVECDLFSDSTIPYAYHSNKRKMDIAVKVLSDWYMISETADYFKTDFEKFAFQLVVDCLTEMLCEDGCQTYKGSYVSYAKVLEKVNECSKNDGGISHFISETIDDYIRAASETEIHDKRKYMKSVIWNSLCTYQVKFQSMFERTYYGGNTATIRS